jgi:hypothetical protein
MVVVMDKSLVELGRVVGETTHSGALFMAYRPPKVGEYVLIDYPGGDKVLGMVEWSRIGNPLITSGIKSLETVIKAESFGANRYEYMLGYARLLTKVRTVIENGAIEAPRHPPPPLAKVYEASDSVLKKIFSKEDELGKPKPGWIKIGYLANHPTVPVYVNINAIVSRHLAILALTGAGKSNTVAVLVDNIVKTLRGTVLIIDMHNEYEGIGGNRFNKIYPKVNPIELSLWEFYRFLHLDAKATKQRMYFRMAYKEAKTTELKRPENFLKTIKTLLEGYYSKPKVQQDRNSIADLLNKFEELLDRYENRVFDITTPSDLRKVVKPGHVNVLMLGNVDEEAADAIASHYIRRLLEDRKKARNNGEKGYPVPVLIVIEEAHILIPKKYNTLTKDVASRIAREGRKFGVGLCLVSQRPKNIDEDALSQTNNKIILKLVEPNDQRYVQSSSETLSDELLELLPSLNVGEAIVLGLMTPLPALVKIEKFEGKKSGEDINIYEEWLKYSETEEKEENIYDELGF